MEHLDHRRHQQAGRGRGRRRRPSDVITDAETSTHDERRQRRPPRSEHPTQSVQHPPDTTQQHPEHPSDAPTPSMTASHPSRPSRRARFKATLTGTPEAQASTSAPRNPKPRRPSPPQDDLTSILTHALRTPPFPDCPICFNPIRPEHSTWSCSPPSTMDDKADSEDKTCCWNTFHLKCIRAWAEKSVKELEEAWRARGESRPGEWRCPGCRTTRQVAPHTYMCFCLRMRQPAPPRIATPHSCAQPCSRQRSGCKHACPLPCHPGPCPPCAVTVQVVCFCSKERRSAKCQVGLTAPSFSCAQPCRKQLGCGNLEHLCAEACHEGPCLRCPEREQVRCWCGQETKYVGCGETKVEEAIKCVVVGEGGSEREWIGSYGCNHPCNRPFACSHHSCSKPCHPPSRIPPPCPFDPERVTSCACGRCRIDGSSDELAAFAPLPPRISCTSPLPTCSSLCSKLLPCGHLCLSPCHWGSCPPCTEQVEHTCRCGATKHKSPCDESVLTRRLERSENEDVLASTDILCDKPCPALRSCGHHQCGRICCPLASLQRSTKPPKRREAHTPSQGDFDLDPATRVLHDCDLPCGRVLACGNHRCLQNDHRGPCGPCLRGVFDELVCPCGRTVLEPPVQCGTRLKCVYPCARPAPACGHPHVEHVCHEVIVAGVDTADEGLGVGEDANQSGACPPCPFLTDKVCACGKKRVSNVRCSQERVSCGSMCGKPLGCGFHHCERPCHADACGTCAAVCGKSRKSCLPAHHPCTQTCHAPAACPETEPCLAPVTLTCPCGHLRSSMPCSGTKLALACTGECEIKKRNARLAEALGISEPDAKREAWAKVNWSPELVGCARVLGSKFIGVVEKAFAEFVGSERKLQVLPHMPPDRRKFVHDLASVYRMDTVMVDQEPHRSVQLNRRVDTRVPVPLLSQHIASTMGRLVELRSVGKGMATGTSASAGGGSVSAWGGAGAATGTSANANASGSGGAGVQGRWNMVATKLGVPRSGSTTPARVPSPASGEVVREREGSPGPTRLVGAGGTKGVWISPSVQAQRVRENATSVGVEPVGGTGETVQDVPDDWEDDV